MSVIRNKRAHHFTIVPNETLRDERLSIQAKGLLAMMLSFPDDWDYNLKHLEGLSENGKHAHRAALHELERAGYVTKEKVIGDGHRFQGWSYVVSDLPRTENQTSDSEDRFSEVRNSEVRESDTTNTYSTKTEGTNPPPPPPQAAEPDQPTEPGDDGGFDPQALRRLQSRDADLRKRLERKAAPKFRSFEHKSLLASYALRDPDRTLAALEATIEGCDGKGGKAWRYFKACYQNHDQPKPNGQASNIDELLRKYMDVEGTYDGEPFIVVAASQDGRALITNGAGTLKPEQVDACRTN